MFPFDCKRCCKSRRYFSQELQMNKALQEKYGVSDEDLRYVENGMMLKKIIDSKNGESQERFFKLDLKTNRILASTKELLKKEKQYPLASIDEVVPGCVTDNLRSLSGLDDLAFVIFYENHKKDLNLIAGTKEERDAWCRVLNYMTKLVKTSGSNSILKTKKVFDSIDADNSNQIGVSELSEYLKSLNIQLDNSKIKALIKKVDKDQDKKLDRAELDEFLKNLNHRPEMEAIYKSICKGENSLSIRNLQSFLHDFQCEDLSNNECAQLINKYEANDEFKSAMKFSFTGFVNYLNNQTIFDPRKAQVYQNMNLPMFNYFINSSHNTYLSGDQLTSKSDPDFYRTAIMNGARLVEMDVYDGPDNRPQIFHQKTLTSKIFFEDALIVCRDFAFALTEFPLIITIEIHCSEEQQNAMAHLIKKHLRGYLYSGNYDGYRETYPTLNELRRKILFRCRKDTKKAKKEDDDDQEDESETNELKKLLPLMQNVTFKGIDFAFENYFAHQTVSLSELKCNDLISAESGERLINYTNYFLNKVYPAFYRAFSDNLEAINYWIYGFQIVALNFQKNDKSIEFNKALFADNGNSGYVLKPEILRNPALGFDPTDLSTMRNKKMFKLIIIGARNLPCEESNLVEDISDPYVSVQICGVPADENKSKTKTIKNNGFNPMWNQELKFVVNCPELAFVRFKVMDEDVGNDDEIGLYTVRFDNILPGYRHIQLENPSKKGTLFIYSEIDNLEPVSHY